MTIFEYVLNFGLVGLVVLHVRGIRLTKAVVLLPVVMTAWAATEVLQSVLTGGNDVALETCFALGGLALGVLAGAATSVRDPARRLLISHATQAAAVAISQAAGTDRDPELRVAPSGALSIRFGAEVPGRSFDIRTASMDFAYADRSVRIDLWSNWHPNSSAENVPAADGSMVFRSIRGGAPGG